MQFVTAAIRALVFLALSVATAYANAVVLLFTLAVVEDSRFAWTDVAVLPPPISVAAAILGAAVFPLATFLLWPCNLRRAAPIVILASLITTAALAPTLAAGAALGSIAVAVGAMACCRWVLASVRGTSAVVRAA